MKVLLFTIYLFALVFFSSGCGVETYAQAIINSYPSGAKLYCNGKYLGETLRILYWHIDDEKYFKGEVFNPTLIRIVHDGFLSEIRNFRLKIEPWMKNKSVVSYNFLVELQ